MCPAAAPVDEARTPIDTEKIIGGPKLLGAMRDFIRRKHSSSRTEQADLQWVKRDILFHGKRHPEEMGEAQSVSFLDHLTIGRNVAASTQNQALNAPVFLYQQVLGRESLALDNLAPAKRPTRLPTVFERGEIERLFQNIDGTSKRIAALPYGSGLRLIEGLRLGIQEIEFERNSIMVRDGRGAKDRVTRLPRPPQQAQRAGLPTATGPPMPPAQAYRPDRCPLRSGAPDQRRGGRGSRCPADLARYQGGGENRPVLARAPAAVPRAPATTTSSPRRR